jgi:hypothetical protein
VWVQSAPPTLERARCPEYTIGFLQPNPRPIDWRAILRWQSDVDVGVFWLTASQKRAFEGARFDIEFRFQASIKRIDRRDRL